MSELPKTDEKYKEFSNIEENLIYIEKAVSSQFSEEAIKEVQGQMIQYNKDKKCEEDLKISILQEKAKIDEGTNNLALFLGFVCFVSFFITGLSFSN